MFKQAGQARTAWLPAMVPALLSAPQLEPAGALSVADLSAALWSDQPVCASGSVGSFL